MQKQETATDDLMAKLVQSIKIIRAAVAEETPEGKEDLVNATLDVAAMFILSNCNMAHHLDRIAHAMEAQTKVLCHAYNVQADANEAANG